MRVSEKQTALMFANMRSGTARRSFFPAVASLNAAGVEVASVQFNLQRESILESVRDAAAKGIRLVIAFGGDGTVGTTVDAIVGQDVVLGVIPAGTSNHFARSVGIPRHIRGAVRAIASGHELQIDLGHVNGHYFAHAAIMGMNVDFARKAERLRGLLGRFSYPVAGLLVYQSRKLMTVKIRAEEADGCELKTYQLSVMRPRPAHFTTDHEPKSEKPVDPSLCILTVGDLRLSTVLEGLPRIFSQRYLGFPGTPYAALKEATIETSEATAMTLDGEIKAYTPATVRMVPDALRVMIPSGSRSVS